MTIKTIMRMLKHVLEEDGDMPIDSIAYHHGRLTILPMGKPHLHISRSEVELDRYKRTPISETEDY